MMWRKRTYLIIISLLLLMGCLIDSWHQDAGLLHDNADRAAVDVIQDWYRHALYAERYSEGYRAPVVARMYGYLGIAGFEVATATNKAEEGYSGIVEGMVRATPPSDPIHLPSALNACYATLMRDFFVMTTHAVQQDRNMVEQRWSDLFTRHDDTDLITRSVQWGEEVAIAIAGWAETDSIGYRAELYNYDKAYTVASGPGIWKPSREHPMPPLLPHWGRVRTFVAHINEYAAKPPMAYSTHHGSAYYTQAYELFAMSSPLSPENKWIAEFWSDDLPGLTISPAGRWISITHQLISQEKPSATIVLETYLKAGVALNDATATCWNDKYRYAGERPEAFIQQYIDPKWRPFHEAPSFPGYPSGHSSMGGAVAEVLTGIFGPEIRITDRTHAGRREFRGDPRTFHSFHEMARENAFSRLPLGVHFRADCEEGLRLGSAIGKKISQLPVSLLPSPDLSMHSDRR